MLPDSVGRIERQSARFQSGALAWLAWSATPSTFCLVLPARTLTAGLPDLCSLARTTLAFRPPQATDLVVGFERSAIVSLERLRRLPSGGAAWLPKTLRALGTLAGLDVAFLDSSGCTP
jgi:hypothetical protein